MKKINLLLFILFSQVLAAQVQRLKVGANTTTLNSSAALEIESTTKGFLPPRMTNAQMTAIATPATGLIAYCTDCNPAGLYVYNSTAWVKSTTDGSKWTTDTANARVALTYLSDGSSARTAGTEFVVTDAGNVGIGTVTPATKLDVTDGDALINGLTIGRGGENIASNTAAGASALTSNTTGFQNTANGASALTSNSTGFQNTANGAVALQYNTTGYQNTAVGVNALRYNTTGFQNTANGASALTSNTTGFQNTANGSAALYSNTTGQNNTANGYAALLSNTTGNNNTAFGYDSGVYTNAGDANATGSNSLFLGYDTRANADGQTNQIVIGASARGNGSNSITLGNTSITSANVKVAWTVTSDARDKNKFEPLQKGLAFITQLKPYSFEFRKSRNTEETDGVKRYGFKAQDIETLENGDFVIVDNKDPEKLKIKETYLIPILVKAVQELETENATLKETIDNQNSLLKELIKRIETLEKNNFFWFCEK